MKQNLIVCLAMMAFCAMAFSFQAPQEGIVWETNFENALEKAKKDNKKLLLNFTGSDWCGWCIRLDKEVFSQDKFVTYAKSDLVCVKLDFPRDKSKVSEGEKKQNNELATQYKVAGFPTILILDAEKNLLMQTGYQFGGAEAYVKHLQDGIAKK